MNEQIEKHELSDSIYMSGHGLDRKDSDDIAEQLYTEGYRKQSEVAEEYRKKVYSKMEKYTVFGREYIQRILREVEKEMKGGAE